MRAVVLEGPQKSLKIEVSDQTPDLVKCSFECMLAEYAMAT